MEIKIKKSDFDIMMRKFKEKIDDVYGPNCQLDRETIDQIICDMKERGIIFESGGYDLYQMLEILKKNESKNNK